MIRTRDRPGVGRRWELTDQELELVARARPGAYGLRELARGVLGRPRLVRQLVRNGVRGALQGVRNDADLLNYVSQRRVARVVPDAATGAAWWGADIFLEVLRPHLRADVCALELGAGAGRIARHAAPNVRELVVTDVSRTMVDEARENLARFPNVVCRQTNGFTLPAFADGSFDLVYAHDVFLLFDGNEALALLDECSRVLVEDGLLVVSLYVIDSRLWADAQLDIARRLANAGHTSVLQIRPWTIRQIERLCEVAGLDVVDCVRAEEREDADPSDFDTVADWNRTLNEAAHCVVVARRGERSG
jgi:SAM-dependent methyltransferase